MSESERSRNLPDYEHAISPEYEDMLQFLSEQLLHCMLTFEPLNKAPVTPKPEGTPASMPTEPWHNSLASDPIVEANGTLSPETD